MENQQTSADTTIALPQSSAQTSVPPPASPVRIPHHTAQWLMLLMLFIFPPIGWYFMWKEKEYHSWFATTIFIYGLFGFILNALIIIFIAPQIQTIYGSLNITDPSFIPGPYVLTLGILISDAQMFFGIYLWNVVKKQGQLAGRLLVVTAMLLFINYIIPTISAVISFWWMLSTIYTVTNAVGK